MNSQNYRTDFKSESCALSGLCSSSSYQRALPFVFADALLGLKLDIVKPLLIISLILLNHSNIISQNELINRPNVLLIVADDLGYTDLGAYGAEINTPVLDKIAAQSIRFSNFHTMPSCAPTRAILLTGADNHQVGLGAQEGGFTKKQKGNPGYEGYLNERTATLPAVLAASGYRTYMSGKWHLGHRDEHSPSKKGFQETFALMPGGASHYHDQLPLHPGEPAVYRRNGKIVNELPADFYSSKNYTDNVLSWMERDKDSEKPFFAYLAHTAPHDPLHAPKSYIEKYKGVYDEGYEVFREKRFKQLQKNGLISSSQKLPPWPKLIPRWADLSESRKKEINRDMETLAAMVDYLDEQIGRVYQWLESNGKLDNTMIIFMSDNGSSGLNSKRIYPTFNKEFESQFNNELSNRGLINSFTNINAGWSVASTALYRDFKGFTSEGGIRTPCFIKPVNSSINTINHSYTHVRDITPTILDLAGINHPSQSNSNLIKMLGKSLLPVFENPMLDIHEGEGIGYELHGTRAFVKDGWKIIQSPILIGSGDWELFNLNEDPVEQNNLIFSHRKKFKELLAGYQAYETEVGVIYDLPGPLGVIRTIFNIILGLLILIFGLAILGKLSGRLKNKYIDWGYGTTFMYGLAVVELNAIAGLFTTYKKYAIWILAIIMIGAIFTLIKNKENWKSYLLPIFTMILLGLYVLLKSEQLMTTLI